MTAAITISWQRETGQLTFAGQGLSQLELLAVFRLCEHALIRQISGAPGRPGQDPAAAPGGSVRAPGLIARKVDG